MNYIEEFKLKGLIKEALKEDIGKADITTESIIPKNKSAKAILLVKENCVVCGLGIAGLVFKIMDKNIKFNSLVKDGESIESGKIIAALKGKAQSILTGERVALNFLCLLSGIATTTRKYVDAVQPYKVNPVRNTTQIKNNVKVSSGVKIIDTRKTIPGLRILEKYAVRMGGGFNHRFSLDEMVMVKDNHLKIQNSKFKIQNLLQRRKKILRGKDIEIEVKNLKEFKEALKLKPDIIMLDNMNTKDIRKAVKIRNGSELKTPSTKPKLEASGGITLKNVRQVASTGIDMISVGALTHSIDSVDISLEIL